jgi:hypothetical protein
MSEAHVLREKLGLRFKLPPDKPFVSLSHAISWIAFRRSTANRALSRLLGLGKGPVCDDRTIQMEQLDRAIKSAVGKLTELGLSGKVVFLGKEYAHVLEDDRANALPTVKIPIVQMADYRCFDHLDDTLYAGSYREIELAWGKNRNEFYSPLEKHYRFVLVNRDDLLREFPDIEGCPAAQKPFTEEELKEWIKEQPQQSADDAHKKFKDHPRYNGIKQNEFRHEWKEVRKTGRGRPKKS